MTETDTRRRNGQKKTAINPACEMLNLSLSLSIFILDFLLYLSRSLAGACFWANFLSPSSCQKSLVYRGSWR